MWAYVGERGEARNYLIGWERSLLRDVRRKISWGSDCSCFGAVVGAGDGVLDGFWACTGSRGVWCEITRQQAREKIFGFQTVYLCAV